MPWSGVKDMMKLRMVGVGEEGAGEGGGEGDGCTGEIWTNRQQCQALQEDSFTIEQQRQTTYKKHGQCGDITACNLNAYLNCLLAIAMSSR